MALGASSNQANVVGSRSMNELPDPLGTRRRVGLGLYLLGVCIGTVMLLIFFVGLPVLEGRVELLGFMCLGAVLAFPAGAIYLTVPRLLDRYDPEPWYALLGCLVWGATAATGLSVLPNSLIAEMAGPGTGEALSAVVSAPIFEEFWKGIAIFGVAYFLHQEFDGVVDGIIYASFTALGFATVENVIYYAQGMSEGALAETLFARGLLSPWAHPVFTCMTGIGFGLSREATSRFVRWGAPFAGFGLAVMLHAIWNGTAVLAPALGVEGAIVFLCMLCLWLLLVITFFVAIIVLVRRRGKIIREYLQDEIALGNVTPDEVDQVCTAFGLLQARMNYGRKGAELVRAIARLALSKWHTTRAQKQDRSTVSMEFIVPLRRRIYDLKMEISQQQGRR